MYALYVCVCKSDYLEFDLLIDMIVGFLKNDSMGTDRLILTISTTYLMIMVKLLDKLSYAHLAGFKF